jgi:hypothetical protein
MESPLARPMPDRGRMGKFAQRNPANAAIIADFTQWGCVMPSPGQTPARVTNARPVVHICKKRHGTWAMNQRAASVPMSWFQG